MVSAAKSAALEAEVESLRRRQEVLLRGLSPKGDVFVGAFIEEDPELRALCELLDLFRGRARAGGRRGPIRGHVLASA